MLGGLRPGASPAMRVARAIVIYVVVPGILMAGAAFALRFREFVRRDPRFCAQCHELREEYTLWTQGSHKSIVCQDCHHQSDREALLTLAQVVGGRSQRKLHSPEVPVDSCAQCHFRHDKNWPQIEGSEGHRVHLEDAKVTCGKCHGRAMHQYGITLDACKDCHEKQVVKATGMERLHCLACHNFLTADEEFKPQRQSCLRCHGSKVKLESSFPENAPMAELACFACHRPHADEKPTYVSCGSCHEKEARHGLHGVAEHGKCNDCHSAHTWTSDRKSCARCHKGILSHYAHKECRDCHDFTGLSPPPEKPR